MNFKAGNLVMLLRATNPFCKPFIGHVTTLDKRPWSHPDSWLMDPPLIAFDGMEICWSEKDMRRIDNPGDDEVDEISLRRVIPEGLPA